MGEQSGDKKTYPQVVEMTVDEGGVYVPEGEIAACKEDGGGATCVLIEANIPLTAVIDSTRIFCREEVSTKWRICSFNKVASIGECLFENREIVTTEQSKIVRVRFRNWSQYKKRRIRLAVHYWHSEVEGRASS